MEVFTADEVTAREEAARTAVKGEYEPKLTDLTGKLTEAEKRAAERAGEFAEFRKLRDEDVAKLSEKDRIIYENQVRFDAAEKQRTADAETAQKSAVDNAIKAKAGDNAALIEKMTTMWDVIKVDAKTPEQIEAKMLMVLGAISTTTPDLVATVNGFGGGSFQPPSTKKDGDSFADTEGGKSLGAKLGLKLETPKA